MSNGKKTLNSKIQFPLKVHVLKVNIEELGRLTGLLYSNLTTTLYGFINNRHLFLIASYMYIILFDMLDLFPLFILHKIKH